MGKLIGNHIIGSVGPLVYKFVDGEVRVSIKPGKGGVKQTLATKQAFNTFGMAASLGKAIRNNLMYQLNGLADFHLPGRLVSALSKILIHCRDRTTRLYQFEENSFKPLVGIEFNIKSPLAKSLYVEPFVVINNGILKVVIPKNINKIDLKFPAKTFHFRMIVNLSLFRLGEGLTLVMPESQEILLSLDKDELPEQELNFILPAGCLCVTSVFIQFARDKSEGSLSFNSKIFNPGKILSAVITPGVYTENIKRHWGDMKVYQQPVSTIAI